MAKTDSEESTKEYDRLMNMHKGRFGASVSTLFLIKLIFCALPTIGFFIYFAPITKFLYKIYYLTQLGETMVVISYLMSLYISFAQVSGIKLSYRFLRIHHILFELAFSIQIIIFLVYWSVLHGTFDDYVRENGIIFHYLLLEIHSVPALSIFFEFTVGNYTIDIEDLKYGVCFAILYTIHNFIITKL